MTRRVGRAPTEVMELDLDAFLASHTSSDEEDQHQLPLRTVDEILNDSDSSSPSSPSSSNHSFLAAQPEASSVCSPKTLLDHTPRSIYFDVDSNYKYNSISRTESARDSFSLGGRTSLPPLFGIGIGSVRSTVKPGAALAAAAAASRSIPTPHAAALKSRRALTATLRNQELAVEAPRGSDGSNSVASETFRSNEKVVQEDFQWDNYQSAVGDVSDEFSGKEENGEKQEEPAPSSQFDKLRFSDSQEILTSSCIEPNIKSPIKPDENLDLEENATLSVSNDFTDGQVPSTSGDENNGVISEFVEASESAENGIVSSPGSSEGRNMENKMEIAMSEASELERAVPCSRDEVSLIGDDTSSRNDVMDLDVDIINQLESKRITKRTEKKSRSSVKPLELAEELEKKHAYSGLDWENDIAAQPMRLEGVRRGSTALGYFDVDANNTITRTISSQAFRRDQGSPQVLAIHLNLIAVGMSKGVVLVIPSKYSPHCVDNMDAKMLMLGLQGDNSHSAVTSMCFNQLGDLLFVGYSNGHVTVWDVLKGSAVKVVSGIHDAPVVHLLYLGQDSQVTRQFRVVSGDSKGLVWLITFSVVPWLNRFSFSTTCLLDGRTTGKVLCACPLLSDEFCGGALMSSQGNATGSSGTIGSMMGGVLGADAGRKLLNEKSSSVEEGVVIFATYQSALVARVSPSVVVYAQLSKPDGVREGSMPYTAWKCMGQQNGSSTENMPVEASEKVSLLAIAWDRKVQVAKLVKSELKIYGKWTLESSAIGVAWLDDQMLVVLTSNGQFFLYAKDGTVIHQTSFAVDGSGGEDLVAYHTEFTNIFGNPEKAYHKCIAVRGASIYILGTMRLVVCRLLPWKERIQVLRKAGDWMGALNMAMTLYDGQAHGVIDLPRTLDAVQEAIMPYLVELLLSYVDEVFSYISVAFCSQIGKLEQLDDSEGRASSVHSEIKEQFARVGGVAVEFCVHIKRTNILFDEILSKFVAVQHKETFLELLEPYILKDMLGTLPPEIMQALVEHYSTKGWLQRVEQCVLHMDISSLDFNQVVRLCREHRLYGALVYLFNRGLDDFRAPLEELLTVLQSSQKESAAALGYRMLVYLKYCFSGLAFPPGHGTLPPIRLPSLRTELLQFLLETSNAPNSSIVTIFLSTGAYLNLYHFLELDTEASLDVLKCAFDEDEIPKSDHSLYDSTNGHVEAQQENASVDVGQNVMVQKTVDALIHVLDRETFQTDKSTSSGDIELVEVWPSKKDIGHMFEFIAYFISCKKAVVSYSILSQILEYYTSNINPPPSVPKQNIETSRKREKKMLALLEAVPETDWDASYVLHLCERSQFYQVCGLIYAIRHQHIAALDSYMKDLDEPVHAFSFINDTLEQLSDTEADSFRSAVISRIPDLISLNREGTFFLVTHHFSRECQDIISELRCHPKSLFLYLKTVFEVHLSGTLNFTCLRKDELMEFPIRRRVRDQSVEVYLERISDFPKFLRSNPVQVTDEMIELYLELLCQYERNSVLRFLETFESYRVEHCLRLCQEYGIIDAAAFLLERVGDVGSALLLTLSGLNEKFIILDTAVDSVVSDVGMEHFSTVLKTKEVSDIREILHACIGLCQRNTPRLDPDESKSLWFQLLDSFCEPLMDSFNEKMVSQRESHVKTLSESVDGQEDKEACIIKWKISKLKKGAHILRKLFSQFIKEIVEGMIGYIRLPIIMSKLLSDNGGQEFGNFKGTILGMLGTYGFERRILDTAKSLIEDDTFYTMSLLKKGASHGYSPRSLLCCLCNCLLTKNSSSSSIRVFNCGHATHLHCELQENDMSHGESAGCPVCMPKKKGQKSRSKTVLAENGLLSKSRLRPQQGHGTISLYPHENDAFENYGYQQISRFDILTNLQKDQRMIQIENIPQLRLAPPAVYHEKVKKGINVLTGETSSSLSRVEKPSKSKRLRDLKVKGSSIRLPLKSNIFGKEKSSKR
ncbi:Vacuolar protein sorting-associated protein [Actinidia chinensis var. chinensis]|uniref:Vacuolar protein sorting-associated protein n=1 Tax=Actinidia chinensis var. chinensis TaxID=1590841 RepID=A0A2R6R7J1_ACTCC|nr:Vacuolar protein sorting-associated protein [Actinidia chinensis var. chinensis]